MVISLVNTMYINFIVILYSIGPEVVFDCDYLDMGVVESGKFVAKSFKVINNTEVPAAFQVKSYIISQKHLSNNLKYIITDYSVCMTPPILCFHLTSSKF